MRKLFLITLICLTSCEVKQSKRVEDQHEILSIFIDNFVKPMESKFPPPAPGSDGEFSQRDSIRIDSLVKNRNEENIDKLFLIAVDSSFKSFDYKIRLVNCSNYSDIIGKSKVINGSDGKINLNKITKKANDSLPVSYTHLTLPTKA